MNCKRIEFKNPRGDNSILFGVIIEKTKNLICFKTDKRVYLVNKEGIVSLTDTDMVFRGKLDE